MKNSTKSKADSGLKERRFDIILGAEDQDLKEIQGALDEDPDAIRYQDYETGETALHIVAGDGHYPLVDFLCSVEGVDPRIRDWEGRDAVDMAAIVGRRDIMARIMRVVEPWLYEDDDPDGPSGADPAADKVIPLTPRTPKGGPA